MFHVLAGYVSLNNPFKWFFFALLLLSAMLASVPFVGHWQVLILVNFMIGQANGIIYAGLY